MQDLNLKLIGTTTRRAPTAPTARHSVRPFTRSSIEKLGIGSLVDAIADGDSVTRPKPAPDVFLYAAKQLGLEPSVWW